MTASELSESAARDPALPASASSAAKAHWYSCAGIAMPLRHQTLEEEWMVIASEIID